VTTQTSVIHDIGYKPYTGPRLGRRQILRALYVHSLRSVFGFGRGPRAKIVPFFVALVLLLPAALNVYASSAGKALVLVPDHMGYNLFLFPVLFVAVAAPELVSRDLRHHTLPLYFARPLRRADYPLAKVLALVTALFMVEILPVLVTFLGQVASDKSGHQIWLDGKADFPAVYVAVFQAVLFSTVSLLIASTTGRRVIATGVIAILFLVTTAVSHVMTDVVGKTWQNHTISCVVPTVTQAQAQAFNGPVFGSGPGGGGNGGGLAVEQLCSGFDFNNDNINDIQLAPDAKAGYADVTLTYQTPVYSMIAKAGAMVNPVDTVEGSRIWIFHSTDNQIPNPSPIGPLYAAELLVLILAAGGGLFLRYRKVSVS